jgi:ABC-type branched-subunit amino acid transport system substrate-binding protein
MRWSSEGDVFRRGLGMRTIRPHSLLLALASMASVLGCNSIVGLSRFSVEDKGAAGSGGSVPGAGGEGGSSGGDDLDASTLDAPEAEVGECETNAQCTERATRDAAEAGVGDGGPVGTVAAVCVRPEHRCVPLLSEDCDRITGEYLDDNAILLGTLFSTKGAQAATNLPRQQSATLAVEEINRAGGIPAPAGGKPRPLVMLSCDESTMLLRAGGHLVTDLHVPAIVGPNTSQDTIDLSNKLTVSAGTLMMTPTAVASSIADLADNELSWLMAPSDVQRAPLMIKQINDLETTIKTDRLVSTVKLGIVFRNDALGIGTQTSLNALILNGKALSDAINTGANGNVKIDPYDFKATDQALIVSKYVTFAPDIVVLAGTAEAITKVMVPLEQAWTAPKRPYYMLIDSVKVPELITAATNNEDLRHRIRGTGITPTATSAPVFNAFSLDYLGRYQVGVGPSGMGPSYDAAYSIAYGLAATRDLPVSGPNIAKGIRKLAGGATTIEVGSPKILAAFQRLTAGESINGIGTFLPLEWDKSNAVVGGTIEMWCIAGPAATPSYKTSGLFFDIKTQGYTGNFTQCGP